MVVPSHAGCQPLRADVLAGFAAVREIFRYGILDTEGEGKRMYIRRLRLQRQVSALEKKVEHFMAVTQDQLDALAASVNAVGAALATDVTNITAEIASLQAANPNLDLTGLQAAVSGLQATQASVDAIDPPAAP